MQCKQGRNRNQVYLCINHVLSLVVLNDLEITQTFTLNVFLLEKVNKPYLKMSKINKVVFFLLLS